MRFNPKLVMEQAKRQVTTSGGPAIDDTQFIEDSVSTLAGYREQILLHASYFDWVSENKPLTSAGLLAAASPSPPEKPLRITASQAEKDMDLLLGEELARTLRYLMKVVPAIKIHSAEVDESDVAYAFKYVRPDGEQFFLATIVKYNEDARGMGAWLASTEFFSYADPAPFARDLYRAALSVRGLAGAFFGKSAATFPEPS